MKVLEGKLVAGKGKFAIVGARFNEFIVSKLISGAEDTLVRHGVDTDDITLVWVPGAEKGCRKAKEKSRRLTICSLEILF